MANKQLTVAELIELLQRIPDKTKWVRAQEHGPVTGIDNCTELDDPTDPDGEDQGTEILITVYNGL